MWRGAWLPRAARPQQDLLHLGPPLLLQLRPPLGLVLGSPLPVLHRQLRGLHRWALSHTLEILRLAPAGGLFESKSCDSLLEPDTDVETEAEDGVTCHETSGHVTCHETSGHVTCHETSGHVSLLPAEGRDCSGQLYKVAPTYCRCCCSTGCPVLLLQC